MNDLSISTFQRVRIGRHEFEFTSLEAVSSAYRATIERLGIGGSQTPRCEILNAGGVVVGSVSYNGRVWLGDWHPGQRPIYSPDGFYGDPQELYWLARRFSEKLQAMLSDEQFQELRRRNRSVPDGVCASHDFCDANMPMAEAFAEIVGHEIAPDSDEDAVIWSKAWSLAKTFHLTAEPALEHAA